MQTFLHTSKTFTYVFMQILLSKSSLLHDRCIWFIVCCLSKSSNLISLCVNLPTMFDNYVVCLWTGLWNTALLFRSSLFSPRSNRSWWGSVAWWRSPSPSQWPRSWRGCAGLSTSLWSSSQRTSSSTSPWTNGLSVTASSLSTPRVQTTNTHIDKSEFY